MIGKEVTIIGGGLAGLTAGIHLSKIGIQVTIIEKSSFPKHKVCGEYISNEVLPYFNWLGLDIENLNPTKITKLQFSTQNGKTINTELPLGGFGISRYILDEFLYKKAILNGCKIIQENVANIEFMEDEFTITMVNNAVLKSKIVLGAFGKRSNIDQKLNRNFIQQKSPWLAVKAHYSGVFNDDLVGLHNFKGGYCGVSKVEEGKINICYLADYETFKQYKNINEYQDNILKKNPNLKYFFENSTLLFDKPLTISQISFEQKKSIENHILMIGDTAGLIHPLCGNGMAMAIHSAKIASELIAQFCTNQIKTRTELETKYQQQWILNFKNRLKTGKIISNILQKPKLSQFLMQLLIIFPFLLSTIIKKTHGKPI
ncbi:FAD-dependent monooxygenase [Flavobacterium sp.]|uniref:NAD(P)/FAD-dependent oxidoreductase n=1 Tax=Flavobacterium sp. TaxID=239 RepID=UPI00286D7072|nr:FAD-dependent monooxygenase [Flavobacterium sp.]